jgi:ABC-2 type transport system permease protein
MNSKLSKYTAFFKNSFKSRMVYRLASIIKLCGAVIVFFIQFSLWSVLLASGVRQDIKLTEMIAYVMITQMVSTLASGNFANELGASIRDGSVIMVFLRPLSFRLYLLSSMLGKNFYGVLTTALPVFIIGCIAVGVPLPPSFQHFAVFAFLIFTGIFIMFELIYVVGLLAFWTQATWFLSWYVSAGVVFFGGSVIPLWFYPETLKTVSIFLPFRYISFEAINYYLGKSPLSAAARSAGLAFLWWLLLFVTGRLLWRVVQRKMTINGG